MSSVRKVFTKPTTSRAVPEIIPLPATTVTTRARVASSSKAKTTVPTPESLIKTLTELNKHKFTTEEVKSFNDNPHVQQLMLLGVPPRDDVKFKRILTDDDNQEPYTGFVKTIISMNEDNITTELKSDFEAYAGGEFKTVLHWGQRKLLLSEIEFLTLFANNNISNINNNNVKDNDDGDKQVVVYVGAAPGRHIPYLSDLFPQLIFHLYDPVKFDITANNKIKIFQQLFSNADAEKYVGQNILFISDIRSVDYESVSEDEYHKGILRDLQTQEQWYITIQPYKALLKFRFPYTNDQTDYLDGDVYFQAWSPVSSTETRLVPSGFTVDYNTGKSIVNKKVYDHIKYEQQLYYYNNVTRVALYPHNVKSKELDHCYDCQCEIHTLGQYLKAYGYPYSTTDISEMSSEITHFLSPSGARSLQSGNVSMEARRQGLRQKTNIGEKMAYTAVKDQQATTLVSNRVENNVWLSYNKITTSISTTNTSDIASSNDNNNNILVTNLLTNVKEFINKVSTVKFRQISNMYNLATYIGEGTKQETYACFYYYTRDIAPICGYILDSTVVALGKHKNTLYVLYNNQYLGLDIYIDTLPRTPETIIDLFVDTLNEIK